MSIYNPLSSSISPSLFLSYTNFQVTSSIPVSSSERTPTSSAVLVSGSVFLLSASAAYTAGLNVQTSVNLNSYVYGVASSDPTDISSSLYDVETPGYSAIGDNATTNNPPQYVEGPIRITTGSQASTTTGSIRIGYGRILRIKDGDNFTVRLGCTNPTAFNYDPNANVDNGSCILPIYGCTNPNSSNYNSAANIDDGSCAIAGCTDPTALNYNPLATTENGTCQYVTNGTFINTNQTTTHTDNSYLNSGISSYNSPTLNTNGSILIQTNGEAYVGPYHVITNSPKIYVIGTTPSLKPTQFVEGNILILRNGNRKYTDNNESISNNLPSAYDKPISQEQLCSNCYFNQNGNCTKWNAEIRMDYWCAAYKPLGVLTPAGDTFRSDFPGMIQTGLTTSGNEFVLDNKKYYIGSYRIMPDGTYFADNTLPFKRIYLKQTLKFGSNKHFTKINKNKQGKQIIQTTTSPSTTVPSTTETTTVSTGTTTPSTSGTGTSYSY